MSQTGSSCVVFPNAGLTVSGPSSLSRSAPTNFVTRNGSKLYLEGAEFKAVGPNVYWLGLDENINASISYPTQGRVLEIMATAAAMGATAIRSTTLGVSTGHPLSVELSRGVFSENALRVIDFAVYAARAYGIRLIIPLTDQYDYYHGGKLDFLRFQNLSTSDESAFYTNTDVIADFKQYIGTLINRTNTYTNVAIGNDPTILAWETGNELNDPPAEWTSEITSYIKSLAPNQLTMDGSYGIQSDALDLPSVDMYSNHFYPPNRHKVRSDAKLVSSHNKAYYVGEYDWTDKYSRYGLFACLIPVILVLIAFCLPNRWFPWSFYLPRWLFPTKHYHRSSTSPPTYASLDDDGNDDIAKGDTHDFPPESPTTHGGQRQRRRVSIKKWMFALSFLLLVPFAALIALEVGPTSLQSFLDNVEDSGAVGSAYWSLFGRDDSCCQWVNHDDGFTLHFRQDSTIKSSLRLTQHAYKMSGAQAAFSLSSTNDLPIIACPQPNITNA